MGQNMSEEEKEAKFKALFERARKGVLAYLMDQGGTLPLDRMHDYSLNTYFIQHQRFSQLMESLVDAKLINYDHGTQVSTITEEGKLFARG